MLAYRLGSIVLAALAALSATKARAQNPIPPPPDAYAAETVTPRVAPTAATYAELPPDPVPTRRGFTFELGLGGGMLFAPGAPAMDGLFGMHLGAGAFLSHDSALLLRLVNHSVGAERSGILAALLIGAQHWPSARVMLGVSMGIGAARTNELARDVVEPLVAGAAIELRVSYAFSQWAHHSLLLSAVPMFILGMNEGGGNAFSQTFIVEWQYH